jgi:hypothetical protein
MEVWDILVHEFWNGHVFIIFPKNYEMQPKWYHEPNDPTLVWPRLGYDDSQPGRPYDS